MATTDVIVRKDKVYGNEVIYPVCIRAQLFADIAGTKSLTAPTIAAIKRLGYVVRLEQQEVEVL